MIAVEVHGSADARLDDLIDRAQRPSAMLREVGRRGANELKSHFRKLDRRRASHRGQRQHFWRQVADSVQNPVTRSRAVVIGISHPAIAQKVFGGTIRAKSAKALTIPVHDAARGRRTSTFENETGIKLFQLRRSGGGLAGLLAGEGPQGIEVFYVLKALVTQQPDPQALPDRRHFGDALVEQSILHLNRNTKN